MLKNIRFIFFLIITSSYPLYAGSNSVDLNLKATQLMQKFAEDSATPGLSVSVGLAGKIIWSKGYGYADLEQKVPVDPALTPAIKEKMDRLLSFR